MSDPEVVILEDEQGEDEEMVEVEIVDNDDADPEDPPEEIAPGLTERTTFLESAAAEATTLSAHQALLTRSLYLASACDQFTETTTIRQIDLPNDDLEATSSVLEFFYRNDYFPDLSSSSAMEYDPTVPSPDNEGIALLRHARVYTLAERLGLPQLAQLARKKIHLTQSTAKGEIAYARFVYKETSPDDQEMRKPVASFWATRSHALRHEAEQEFRRMCLEFPQFAFDVLSLVLDAQERGSQTGASGGPEPGGKRQRMSQI